MNPKIGLVAFAAFYLSGMIDWIKEWLASDNGPIALLTGLLLAVILALGAVLRRYLKNRESQHPDTRTTKERYLEYLIEAHQHLPVAGFETNVRVPIPLEKVFVTLRARMTELDRLRDVSIALDRDGSVAPDRDVKIEEALQFALDRDFDGVVILGNPGSGKTTLAKYFALCFATDKAKQNLGLSQNLLPILLFLRDIDPDQSLLENTISHLNKFDLELDEGFFRRYLESGEAILLLDGLDEVPTEEKREMVSHWIHERVHLTFSKCPILVTSRFSGYRGDAVLPGHYLRLEIQDYDLPQVKQFLENWLTAVETHVNADTDYWKTTAKGMAHNLYERIQDTEALRDLAVNPLMLQIIALVHRDRGTLPERRVELSGIPDRRTDSQPPIF